MSEGSPKITLRTLGARQRVLLLAARDAALNLTHAGDCIAALRLHEMGLLARGRTSRDYWITAKGEEVANG